MGLKPGVNPIQVDIGRIVRYQEAQSDSNLPMIVTHVHSDNVVSGVVFDAMMSQATGGTRIVRSVEYSKDTPTTGDRWFWPPHMVGPKGA